MNSRESPIIWLTGMSGSGKTTLSNDLESLFMKHKYGVYVLDGDDIRAKDEEKLGFGHEDVMKNNLRISDLCKTLRKRYDVIVIPVISPYGDVRMKVRSILEPNFHLIYLKSDIESLRRRDTKGLYSKSDKGIIKDLIGYSETNPYEEPNNAELVVETSNEVSIDESREKLFSYIKKYIF
jgi:adenylyl-sulfate kinase